MNRYIQTVYQPTTVIRYDLMVKDAVQAVRDRFLSSFERKWQRIKQCAQAAGIAALAGICLAATVYQQLSA